MDDPAQSGEQLKAGTGCDPTPLTANNDQDGDGFLNRQDNCPLAANLAAQTGVPLCTLVSDIFPPGAATYEQVMSWNADELVRCLAG